MNHEILIGISAIIVLGITAQWLSWKIKIPSILLLLLFGFTAGPITGFINPDELFGDLLFPVVSISVALILFEGGLSLKFSELKKTGGIVIKLVSIGALVTWILSTLFSYFILGFSIQISVLFGAILIVTGPTVIIPLLRHVRASGKIGSIVKWEGIVNDPIGAIISVLVLDAILLAGFQNTIVSTGFSILKVIFIGGLLGAAAALVLIFLLKRFWIPSYLHSSFTLMLVVIAFTISNIFQSESGLLAVTFMGILMANQKQVSLKHIIEFKENLGILLLSFLFIVLSARIRVEDIQFIGFDSFLFLILLVIVVRPLSVLAATVKSGLNWKEKLFISMMAPRGIVAAAVTSIFAIKLLSYSENIEAAQIVPEMFFIIVGTVFIYGLSAVPLGRCLGLATPNPEGVVIAGAHNWAIEIGLILKSSGFEILMIDTNREHIRQARMKGLNTMHGSIISDYILEDVDFAKYGKLLAVTQNDEVNSLAIMHYNELFGKSGVFQLSPHKEDAPKKEALAKPLSGRIMFKKELTFEKISDLFNSGYKLKANKITDRFTIETFYQNNDENAVVMFIITEDKKLKLVSTDVELEVEDGDKIISLVKEKSDQQEN